MKKDSGWLIAALFLGITVGIFNVGLFLIFLVWGMMRLFQIETSYFDMVGALSTALAAAAVFGAGYIAYRELKSMSDSQHLEGADRVFNELNSVENIDARGFVYRAFLGDEKKAYQDLTEEDLDAIKSVLNSLDRVAFLIYADEGWVPEDTVMPWVHPIIYKSWKSLAGYVAYERKRRNEPYFYEHAERLGKACFAWREDHDIPDEFTIVEQTC